MSYVFNAVAVLILFHLLQVFQGMAWVNTKDLDSDKYNCSHGLCDLIKDKNNLDDLKE